jgi:hypothetical protein
MSALPSHVSDLRDRVPAPERTLRMFPIVESQAPSRDPRWLSDLLALPLVLRARAMGRALLFLLARPRAFGEAWARGDEGIPNPGVAMATAVSILTILGEQVQGLRHIERSHTFLATLGWSCGPYVLYASMGIVAHLVLRLLGSTRKLSTSIGTVLLVGAGPGTVSALGLSVLVAGIVAKYGSLEPHAATPLLLLAAAPTMIFQVYAWIICQLALSGAHGVARWKGVVAGIVALIVVGFACGAVETSERFGEKTSWWLGPHLCLHWSSLPFNAHVTW